MPLLSQAWIGLDVGTTSSKAVVYDDAGRPLAQGRAPTPWRRSAEGVELDPGELLAAALHALAQAAGGTPQTSVIAGIGVTGMGETGVLVGPRGEPLAPAIAWHDTRDDLETQELRRDIGEETFGARAGKPLRGQFSLTKHRWLVRHGDISRAARRFNVAEWVVRGLGAGEVCDRALACRTGWFDLTAGPAGQWWDDALAWSGASRGLMPELVDAGVPAGRASAGHPRLAGAVVTTAGHDHQCAALGVGATTLGDEFDSCGTAEALVRTVPAGLAAADVLRLARAGVTTDLCIQPGRWSVLGGTEAGLAMQATLDRLGVDRPGLAALDRAALAKDPGPGDDWRSTVEAETARAAALHDAVSAVVGPHNRLIAAGGWCHSAMVLDAKRRAFGAVEVSPVAEAGTLGAAMTAARAAGSQLAVAR